MLLSLLPLWGMAVPPPPAEPPVGLIARAHGGLCRGGAEIQVRAGPPPLAPVVSCLLIDVFMSQGIMNYRCKPGQQQNETAAGRQKGRKRPRHPEPGRPAPRPPDPGRMFHLGVAQPCSAFHATSHLPPAQTLTTDLTLDSRLST
jgi:hypothetical protein